MSEFKSVTTESKPAESAPAAEPQNPDRVQTKGDDVPIALHEELRGIPYTAEFFEVQDIWKNSKIDMSDDILGIESAYRDKVSSGQLQDGEKSFKDFIKEAEKATNTKNSPPVVKIAKIAKWVEFMNDLSEIDKNRNKYGRTA